MKLELVILSVVSSSATAHADRWFTAEIPAATAVTGMQEQTFRTGVMPAFGAYVGNHRLSLGVRLRAGIMRDGDAPPDHVVDPGRGGLATGGIAGRLGIAGGWAELVAGGGITGRDAVPAFEVGVGWTFAVGTLGIGPSARYLRVVSTSSDVPGSANLVLVGIDLQFGSHRGAAPSRSIAEPPAESLAQIAPQQHALELVEPDGDRIEDGDSSCIDLMVAGDPGSGCPAPPAITVLDDRIILDERVLFDTDRAHVKSAGRELIARIAEAWRMHPEWKAMSIEGHSDLRGPDDYNLRLSQLRAERTRAELLKHGFAPEQVTATGYGRARPRDPGNSERAHERNRRVEFVIETSEP